jgi:hypothetical protein
MSLQELGSLLFYHQKEHQFHFIEELKMKVVVILHEGHPCPKLQNPILGKAEKNLLPWEEEPVRADEGPWKTLISGPHPPPRRSPLSRRAWVQCCTMDSATPRRMTGILKLQYLFLNNDLFNETTHFSLIF